MSDSRLARLLGARVDASSIAAFRLAVGVVIAFESIRMLAPEGGADGVSTLDRLFFAPAPGAPPGAPNGSLGSSVVSSLERAQLHLPYPGLDFLVVDERWLLVLLVAAMGVCGAGLALGLLPRLAAAAVTLCWTTLWLQDASLYNNHHYLMSLLALLLTFVGSAPPLLARAAWRSAREGRPTVAFGSVAILRAQLVITYFFAGVAKCTTTWWVHAEPLRSHLALPATRARLEALLPADLAAATATEAFAHALSRAGLAVDLLVGPFLLIRRTRGLAVATLVLFHATNHFVLFDDIGLFPLLGVLTLPIFFAPDWPRRLFAALGRGDASAATLQPDRSAASVSAIRAAWVAFVAVQVLLPLRHLAIDGNVDWTGQGARFAWRMKSHATRAGRFAVELRDASVLKATPDGRQAIDWREWPDEPWLLREVDPFDARWADQPRLVVVWHPLTGERLLLNPYSRERAGPIVLSATPLPTRDRDAILEEMHALSTDTELRRLAREVDDASSRAGARVASGRLRAAIDRLAVDPVIGAQVRALLREARPFELEGGPREGASFAIVEAPGLEASEDVVLAGFPRVGSIGTAIVAVPGAARPPPVARVAVVGIGAPRLHVALPRAFVRRDVEGRFRIEWNPSAELSTRRLQKVRTRPGLLHTYLNDVADRWEAATGRRPGVFVEAYAGLVPYPVKQLIDSGTDLASVAWPWGASEWIEPLDPTRISEPLAESVSP